MKRDHIRFRFFTFYMAARLIKLSFFTALLTFFCSIVLAQKKVEFKSEDNILITADLYETENEVSDYIILLHQAGYSRGEYKEIGAKLIKLGFNCLAIDLRIGGEVNYVANETASRMKNGTKQYTMLDTRKDLNAAINYIYSYEKSPRIIVFGSSFSASIALMATSEDPRINAVIAYSPGEFFEPDISVAKAIAGLTKPAYIACPRSEYVYVEKLISNAPKENMTVFSPERGDGLHGAKTLWWESATRNEFWLSLLFFLNDFKKQ